MIDDDPNPSDGAVSRGAIYVAIHEEYGPDWVRYLLDGVLAGNFDDINGQPFTLSQEDLERDAEELTAIGLSQVADIVTEAAAKATPAHILDCPYDPPDTYIYKAWHRCWSASTPKAGHPSRPTLSHKRQDRPKSAKTLTQGDD